MPISAPTLAMLTVLTETTRMPASSTGPASGSSTPKNRCQREKPDRGRRRAHVRRDRGERVGRRAHHDRDRVDGEREDQVERIEDRRARARPAPAPAARSTGSCTGCRRPTAGSSARSSSGSPSSRGVWRAPTRSRSVGPSEPECSRMRPPIKPRLLPIHTQFIRRRPPGPSCSRRCATSGPRCATARRPSGAAMTPTG